MSDTVTKTIVGQCEEISEKNGWTTFHIGVGSQYPVRVATKLPAVIEQARAVGTETATWTFKERESDEINEKSGRPFVNRYLDKVELGSHPVAEEGTTGVTSAPERPQTGEHAPLAVGDRERSIVRQACLKAAVVLYQGKGADKRGQGTEDAPVWQDETVTLTIMAAARFEDWVMRDLEDPPF